MGERNVVILGKVGAGKRTLANRIAGQEIFERKNPLPGVGDVDDCSKKCRIEDTDFNILIVDTESMQTEYCDPLPVIRSHFVNIHLIIFVIANGRYTDESHRSLKDAIKSLSKAKQCSALVITHCEGITDENRRSIVAEFEATLKVAAFFGKKSFSLQVEA